MTQDALFQSLYPRLGQWPLKLAAERLEGGEHGDFARWQEAIDSLPAPSPGPSSASRNLAPVGVWDTSSMWDRFALMI